MIKHELLEYTHFLAHGHTGAYEVRMITARLRTSVAGIPVLEASYTFPETDVISIAGEAGQQVWDESHVEAIATPHADAKLAQMTATA